MQAAAAAGIVLGTPALVMAHATGRSFCDIKPTDDGVSVVFDLDPDDFDDTLRPRFDNDRSGFVDAEELRRHEKVLAGIMSHALVVSRGGERCTGDVRSSRVSDAALMVRAHLFYACSSGGDIAVEAPILERTRPNHVIILSVRLPEGMTGGLLSANTPRWAQAPEGTVWSDTARFFWLGLEHILVGYDHLLFLFALLLVAAPLRDLVKIVTAFTVAHSITLIIAALDIFTLPGHIVEPAIALTIVYVGVENFVVKRADRRWMLTFALGLVHGFGFAGLLKDAGLPSESRVLPLLSFNVGVEVGQLLIVLVTIPLLARLRRWDRYRRVVLQGGSTVVIALGLYWFVRRLVSC